MLVESLADSHVGGPGDDFVVVQWTAEIGEHWIAPLHIHREDDEAWYVLRGKLGFQLDDEEFVAGPGSAVLARRGTAHTYWNAADDEAESDVPALFAAHASDILS